MLKITELNKVFKEKSFFTSAGSYNELLKKARGLAREVDEKVDLISKILDELNPQIDSLEMEINNMKLKYHRAVRRDIKTGRYLKIKK